VVLRHTNRAPAPRSVLEIHAGGDAQPRVALEPVEQSLEVVRREVDIAIELDEVVEGEVAGVLQAVVEGMHHGGARLSGLHVLARHDLDPRVVERIAAEDVGSGVPGAVVHDDPADRRERLFRHGTQCPFDIALLVLDGGDDQVARWQSGLHVHRTARRSALAE
jgi:hypothetical protein